MLGESVNLLLRVGGRRESLQAGPSRFALQASVIELTSVSVTFVGGVRLPKVSLPAEAY